MALIQWKQLDTDLTSSLYSGSLNVTGSIVLNGIDLSIDQNIFQQTGSYWNTTRNIGVTGSITATEGISGSFSGSGANLFDIPASGIVGLNLSQIISGSVSASISPDSGLQVNTNVVATSFTGSLQGTSSFAISASFASTASFVPGGVTGTGSNGQVAFWDGANSQTGDNGLFWDNTNKRLGVGTTAPAYGISHIGSIGVASFFSQRDFGANALSQLTQRASFIGYTFNDGTNGIAMGANGTGAYIQGFTGTLANPSARQIVLQTFGGNVGIGVNPSARLDVRAQGALSTDIALRVRDSGDTTNLLSVTGNGITTIIGGADGGINSGVLVVQNTIPWSGFQWIQTWKNSAGTSVASLSAQGGFSTAAAISGLTLTATSGGNATFRAISVNSTSGFYGSTGIRFATNNLDRGGFTNDGNFVIGATTAGARLDVRAQGALSTDIAFRVRNSTDTANLISVAGNGAVNIPVTAQIDTLTVLNTTRIGSVSAIAPSAQLDVQSTTKGFLPPRMTTTQRDAIISPARGLILYATSSTDEGIYYYNSGSQIGWHKLLSDTGSQSITGSLEVTQGITGSLFGTASQAISSSYASSSSFSTTSSFVTPLIQNVEITGSLKLIQSTFTLEATQDSGVIIKNPGPGLKVISEQATALEVLGGSNGSNIATFKSDNTENILAYISTDGSIFTTGSLIAIQGITGSLFGTASQAISSSYALTASYLDNYVPPFPFTGSAVITGSLEVTGSISSTLLTGSDNRVVVADPQGTLQTTNQTIIDAYIDPNGTQAGQLNTTSNWSIYGEYIGAGITDTFQGQRHYNIDYFFECINDNDWIRLIRG